MSIEHSSGKNQWITLNNGIRIPQVGLGTWQTPAGKVCEEAVLSALRAGYRHIDTAAIYRNERSVGDAIRKSGIPRAEIFVTTKLWNEDQKDVVKAYEHSLSELGLDYVDLYLMHFPVSGTRLDAWKEMEKLYADKRCRAIGVSNFTLRHLHELLRVAVIKPAVNQVEMHPYLYQDNLAEFCKGQGIHIEAYSPLTRGKKLKDKDIVGIAVRVGKTSAQVLIRWSMQHGFIVLPKSVHEERIKENFDVFDFKLTPTDMGLLDQLDEGLRLCWDPTDVP